MIILAISIVNIFVAIEHDIMKYSTFLALCAFKKGVNNAHITITSAAAAEMIVGALISGNMPGAVVLSILFAIVLSSPSLVAAKQHSTKPKINSRIMMRPHVCIAAL